MALEEEENPPKTKSFLVIILRRSANERVTVFCASTFMIRSEKLGKGATSLRDLMSIAGDIKDLRGFVDVSLHWNNRYQSMITGDV